MNLSNLDERKRKILSIVYYSKSPLQKEYIASKLGVSSRTISSDIEDMNYYFKSLGMEIVSKPRIGTWLEFKEGKKDELDLEILKIFSDVKDEEYKRVNFILKKLLMTDTFISMQEIADELYISKATVNLEIKYAEETLKKYKITLIKKTKHGMKVSGEEKNIRAVLTKILKDENDVFILISNHMDVEMRLDLQLSDFIYQNFNSSLIHYLKEFINRISSDDEFRLSQERLTELVSQLLVTYYRLERNKIIQFSTDEILEIITLPEFKMVKNFIDGFEKDVKIKIPLEEVSYLTLFFIEDKINIEEFYNIEKDIFLNEDEELLAITNEICNFVKRSYNLDLRRDKQLMKGLRLHLASAMSRLKFGIDLSNPLIEEIKRNYPYAFQIAMDIGNHVRDSFQITMTENEIGYVTIHIEAFIERNLINNNRKIKVFIVCGTGIGVSQLLAIQIKKQFPNIEVIKLVSALWITREMNSSNYEDIADMIITSIPLPDISMTVVQVGPILTPEDISKIQFQIDNLTKEEKRLKDEKYLMIKKYLFKEILIIDGSVNNPNDVIKVLSKKLEDQRYVTKDFVKSAISREEVSCTYLSNGVAIPHGYINEVKEPAVILAKLREPIIWGGNKAELIFLFALNSKVGNDGEKLFTELYEIINNKDLIKKIKQINSKEDLFKYLEWKQ